MTTREAKEKVGLPIGERLAIMAKNSKDSPIQRMQRDILLRQIAIVQREDLTKADASFLKKAIEHLLTGENLAAVDGHRVDALVMRYAPHVTGGKVKKRSGR